MLRRRVRFLRVVALGFNWDALDQPDDAPAPLETIYAYEAVGEGGMCHIHASGGRGGFFSIQEYAFIKDQPDDATMRDREKWVAWVEARAERLGLK